MSGSLCERNGLTVLWALGHVHDAWERDNSFYYLPEVDLYSDEDKNNREEIDILCVKAGIFYAAEVKKSVFSFLKNKKGKSTKNEINKFIRKVKLIKPDKALLVFESYCHDKKNENALKKEIARAVSKIQKDTGVETKYLVACDIKSFSEYPTNLGIWGRRTNKLFYKD